MSYKSALIGNVFVLRWHTPEADDPPRILAEVERAVEEGDGPILYVAISPEDSPAPGKDVRGALVGLAEQAVKICDRVHMVFEAKGFKAAIKRNVTTGIMLASRKLSSIVVHSSRQELFARLADHTDVEVLKSRMQELRLDE